MQVVLVRVSYSGMRADTAQQSVETTTNTVINLPSTHSASPRQYTDVIISFCLTDNPKYEIQVQSNQISECNIPKSLQKDLEDCLCGARRSLSCPCDSCWNLVELFLAESPAKIAIPGTIYSSGIEPFQNWHWNGPGMDQNGIWWNAVLHL